MSSEIIPSAPLAINWAINNTCNFRCRHCSSRGDTAEELSFATLSHCLEKVAKAGVMAISFHGGEPLLRVDLLDVVRWAVRMGLAVSIKSNGYLIDERCARGLKAAGVQEVCISLNSHLPELHDRFCGVPGSHERAVAALAHLRAAGIKTSMSATLGSFHFEQLIEFAAHQQVCKIHFHGSRCSGRYFAKGDQLELSPQEWREFYEPPLDAKTRTFAMDISLDDPNGPSFGMNQTCKHLTGSVCGKFSLDIRSNGDITPCGFVPAVIGNIISDDLKAVWHASPVLNQLRKEMSDRKCGGCGSYVDCIGVLGAAALGATGDLNSPDPQCRA